MSGEKGVAEGIAASQQQHELTWEVYCHFISFGVFTLKIYR